MTTKCTGSLIEHVTGWGVFVVEKKSRRSITDKEIALVRAMLQRGIEKTTVQAYFTHPDRRVNFGRITNIERNEYGPDIAPATNEELDKFLEDWRTLRGNPIQELADAAVDFSSLPPVDPKRLLAFFEVEDGLPPRLRDGETEEIECKSSFHGPNDHKVLRAVAAFANNRGGYILFGVGDAPSVIVGLQNDRFTKLDVNRFSMTFRDAMEPAPSFEVGHLKWQDKLVGALFVHGATEQPVIATKDEGSFRAGTIYYRYAGESRPIGAAEFRRILSERDRKARIEAAELATKTAELGPNAALLDLSTGELQGRSSALYLTPDLLAKVQFIREGEFQESKGAPALKLIGDVQVGPDRPIEIFREKVVRQGITDHDVLRNFLDKVDVKFPAEYIAHGCHTAKRYLPLFFYAGQTGATSQELIEMLLKEEATHPVSRGYIIDRIQGRVSAGKPETAASRELTEMMHLRKEVVVTTLPDVRRLALATQGIVDNSIPVEVLLSLLDYLTLSARNFGNADPGTEIRRAAGWIDELYYRPRIPAE